MRIPMDAFHIGVYLNQDQPDGSGTCVSRCTERTGMPQRLPLLLLLALCVGSRALVPPGAPTVRFGTLSASCGLQEIYTVLEDTALNFATSYIRNRGGIVRIPY